MYLCSSLGTKAQLEYEVESEAEDEGHEAPEGPEELRDSGVAHSENVAEDLRQLPPPSPNQQSANIVPGELPAVDPPAVATMGTGEIPAVNPPDVASMETGELPAVNPPAVEIMGQTTVAEDGRYASEANWRCSTAC
ncbi:hypothetical protein R1sor_004953 [Riccia sorocarpa]|uniref:Uncharacterized protein n=1 Tax=Riccia sorocarpa TaxID=122646 RepID=A0ABD3HLN4_9MARC